MNRPTENEPETLPNVDDRFLKYEIHRLETYQTWPIGIPVSGKELAKNGFYYTGTGDRVQCVFCKGILKDWKTGDKPDLKHNNEFPRCPFILGANVSNVPDLPPNSSHNMPSNVGFTNNQPTSNRESIEINRAKAKNPLFATESSRITTFRNWPTYKHQTPEALAAAGFFFAGSGDNVKCFHCDGGLGNWEVDDDPWVEHARWFPTCPFVISVKGQDFIRAVQDTLNQPATAAGSHVIEESDIKDRMDLPIVKTVISTGISESCVMKAIEKRLRETGETFTNAEDLLETVLTMEDQTEDRCVSTQTTGIRTLAGTSHQKEASFTNSDIGNSSFLNDDAFSEAMHTMEAQSEEISITSQTTGPSTSDHFKRKRSRLKSVKERITCKICMDKKVGITFLPCGHLCCCIQCAISLVYCCVCRTSIKGKVRTNI